MKISKKEIIPIIESVRIPAFQKRLRDRQALFMAEAEQVVLPIVQDVAKRGDRALLEWTERLDHIKLSRKQLGVTPGDLFESSGGMNPAVQTAFEIAIDRVETFHKRQVPKSWEVHRKGARLGQRVRPLDSIGIYVPGGRAAYPSSIIMAAIPAKVAGVSRIVVVTPPGNLDHHPELMAILSLLEIQEVYRVGGAQAIAALAYGTQTIRPVDKIVGPGNAYVAAAKRLVFGRVDIDMIAGPTEIVIVADKSTPPDWIAADLLSQAEHDVLASSICFTDCRLHAEQIQSRLGKLIQDLPKREIATQSLQRFGGILIIEERKEASELVNQMAPEHLELMLENPHDFAMHIRHAGAIFFGRHTPEAVGDYIAGPSHILPTGGTARFSSPLGVYDFVKFSSMIEYSEKRLKQDLHAIEQMAEMEELRAHANSVRIRFKDTQ